MARAKKEKLSLEELLEQALLKQEDQLKEVPKNWIDVRLGAMLKEIKNGTTIKQNKDKVGVIVTRIESLQNNKIDFQRVGYIEDTSKIKDNDWYIANDVAISHINSVEHVGKAALINKEILPLVHGMNLLRLRFEHICNPKYFFYYTQSFEYKADIVARINMAVNQVSINQKQISDLPLPLPPLAEQQRIVERIESLFEKLDIAKELAQNALDSFENRKAAILHKAFTGELTAKWREENGVSLDSWEECEIEKLGEVKGGKRLPKGETLVSQNTGFPYIKAGDLKNGTVLLEQLQYVTPEIQELIKNYTVKKGDIYITIVGACIGDVGIIPEEVDGANLTENAAKITNLKCNNKYLAICLASGKLQEQIKGKIASATLGKLSLTSIKSIGVPVPTLKEQCEIVNTLENLLANEQQAQELCDVIEKIDLMKKAILARAFRGELGTNNPEEESAIELLKEVLKEKL